MSILTHKNSSVRFLLGNSLLPRLIQTQSLKQSCLQRRYNIFQKQRERKYSIWSLSRNKMPSMKDQTKIVIVGGVAGGMSAATRARRLDEDASITVFERGPYVSYANCGIPYALGGEIEDDNSLLLQSPQAL